MKKNIIPLLILLCAIGCAGIYQSTVTVTSVVDSAMRVWADLSVAGKTTPAIDARVITAHNLYRAACASTQAALRDYKASGDPAPYNQAVTELKQAAAGILEPMAPLLSPSKVSKFQREIEVSRI